MLTKKIPTFSHNISNGALDNHNTKTHGWCAIKIWTFHKIYLNY